MKGTGNVYNSKYKSSVSNTMASRFKLPYYKKLDTPGPGSYQTFSEFGIYKSKYADEMERKQYRNYNKFERNAKTPNPMRRNNMKLKTTSSKKSQ